MSIVNDLLSKGMIPILNHSNPTYTFMEGESARAARGLLPGRSVQFFVINSVQKNAYTFKANDQYLITMTDTLFRVMEESIGALLNHEAIRRFIVEWLRLDYFVKTPIPKNMTWGTEPHRPADSAEGDLWFSIFEETFRNALIFTLLHEIAHIGHGDVDGVTSEASPDIYLRVVRTVELMTYGGTGKNRDFRFHEYDADREAACWLSQRTIKRVLDEPTHDFGVAHLGLASFGMLMVLLHLSRHDADTQEMMQSFDHPSYDVRLEGAWEG